VLCVISNSWLNRQFNKNAENAENAEKCRKMQKNAEKW
tara:strand:+ start:398 stop:511 length:114 start_codon:yes stop_codon:yes gene_type:complete